MRKFGKRLLAALISGAMALSLFPAVGLSDAIVAKAAGEEIEFIGLERNKLPGDREDISRLDFEIGGEFCQAEVTGVTIPNAYRDYLYVIPGEDWDNNGSPDNYEIRSDVEWDENGRMIRNGANNIQDSVGKTVPIEVSYNDGQGHSGKTTLTWNIKKDIYEFAQIYDDHGANMQILPGYFTEVTFYVRHRSSTWNENEKCYFNYEEIDNDLNYQYVPLNPEDDRITLSGTTNWITLNAKKDIENGVFWPYDVNVYKDGALVLHDTFAASSSECFFGISPAGMDNYIQEYMRIGEVAQFKLNLVRFDLENPYGVLCEGTDYSFDYDDNTFLLEDLGNHEYRVTRTGENGGFIRARIDYTQVGENGEEMSGTCETSEARVSFLNTEPGEIYCDNGIEIFYEDDTAKVVGIRTDEMDDAYEDENGYSIKWKIGKGTWDNNFETLLGNDGNGYTTTNAADGVKISADGKTLTFDLSKVIKKFNVEEDEYGNRWIDGNDGKDRLFVQACFMDKSGNEFRSRFRDFRIEVAKADTSIFDPGRYEGMMWGDVLYLDQYYYFVANKKYPGGRYLPADIQVTKITGYWGIDGETNTFYDEKNATVELDETTYGRPALVANAKVYDEIPENYNAFGLNKVEYTYTDQNGKKQKSFMIVDVHDKDYEFSLDNIECSDPRFDSVKPSDFGKYQIAAFNGDTVSADVRITERRYDYESGKVVSEDITDSLKKLSCECDSSSSNVKLTGNHLTLSGQNDWNSIRILAQIEEKNPEGDTWINNWESWIDFYFADTIQVFEGLNVEELQKNESVTWNPSYQQKMYDYDKGGVSYFERENVLFGFSYNPEEISITVNGTEAGDVFSNGPFVIRKLVDKKVKLIPLVADWELTDPEDREGIVRFRDVNNASMTGGINLTKWHDEHLWSDVVVGKPASLTEDGYMESACSVGGEKKVEATIAKIATVEAKTLTYNKKAQVPVIVVKDSNKKVIDSKYYDVAVKAQTNYGVYEAVVTFKDRYIGTKTVSWKIAKAPVEISGMKFANKTYDGLAAMKVAGTPKLTGVLSGDTVTVSYVGTAKLAPSNGKYPANVGTKTKWIARGKFKLSGKDAKNYYIKSAVKIIGQVNKAKIAKLTLKATSTKYTGKAIKPVVSAVKDANGKAVKAANYKVTYYKYNTSTKKYVSATTIKAKGTYKVRVTTANGNYSGYAEATFTVK